MAGHDGYSNSGHALSSMAEPDMLVVVDANTKPSRARHAVSSDFDTGLARTAEKRELSETESCSYEVAATTACQHLHPSTVARSS